jgi:hypothetical protein
LKGLSLILQKKKTNSYLSGVSPLNRTKVVFWFLAPGANLVANFTLQLLATAGHVDESTVGTTRVAAASKVPLLGQELVQQQLICSLVCAQQVMKTLPRFHAGAAERTLHQARRVCLKTIVQQIEPNGVEPARAADSTFAIVLIVALRSRRDLVKTNTASC